MFQSQANNLGLVKFQLPHLSFRALGGFFPPCAGGAPAVKRFHSIGTLLLSVTALMTLVLVGIFAIDAARALERRELARRVPRIVEISTDLFLLHFELVYPTSSTARS